MIDQSKILDPSGGFMPGTFPERTPSRPVAVQASTMPSAAFDAHGGVPVSNSPQIGLRARQRRGWGPLYEPNLMDEDGRLEFRRICNDLDAEICALRASLVGETIPDEASGAMAEIQRLLELLYDCPFGEGESLKSAVVALQSQLNNAQWTVKHVDFLDAAIQHLRVRSVVNDQTVDAINKMITEIGLDVFRGTVSDSQVLATYAIRKIDKP